MAWSDNHNCIYQKEIPIDATRRWQFRIEEHKVNGSLSISARMFRKTDSYDGPTKNGFIQQINSLEDIDNLEKAFQDLFNEARNKL